ncbi:GNAT family N-acetyltransferase [Bacillus sp. BRMEA1]|uniref:GNAT family N-acetyltransferase n=1 Tax=Neobacillus endophyticus TaxID=2738405 RepID=UPI001562FEC8|nr:GNAT family N-acetyltransferase [Neobacillus endophyticus]NRD79859.1 GNAT family N-acetyltransferase [Neobacillus endophyticus]
MFNEFSPFTVRSATLKDFMGISNLKEQVQQLHIEGRPDLYADASASLEIATYETWLNSTDTKIFIVEDNDKEIIAYIILDIKKPADSNPILRERKILFIRSIGVSKTCRGQGIGKILIKKAFEYCKEIHAESVELNVLEFNENAIRFYEKLGFKTKSRQLEWLVFNN